MVVPQISARYASQVFGGRYQVLAHNVGSAFYIVDLDKDEFDLTLRDDKRRMIMFTSAAEAEKFIHTNLLKDVEMAKRRVEASVEEGFPSKNEGEKIGQFIQRLIKLGATNAEILPHVHAQYPNNKTNMSSVYNARRMLRQDEEPVRSRPPAIDRSIYTTLRSRIDTRVKQAALAGILHQAVNVLEGL